MAKLTDAMTRGLERSSEAAVERNLDSLFVQAQHRDGDAERIAYSNYSYWGSTFRVFLKKKSTVFFLVVLIALLVFTFVQPLLPGQYPATLIINHPLTGKQMSNVPPSLTTVMKVAPSGTELSVSECAEPGWSVVTNAVMTIPRRTKVEATEYLGDYIRIAHKDVEGYVKNDFTTKLKLPDDPAAVPYETQSNFPLTLYSTPDDYTNESAELFAETAQLSLSEDGTKGVAVEDVELRTLPSRHPFLFGTNNIGQDLWALVWSGTRTSLFIGVMVALVEALVGILVGVLWGYVRKLDRLLTEVYNVVDNIPSTIVLILISYILRPGIGTLIFAMCLTSWVRMALFIRNQILIIRDRDYNLASRCLGTGTMQIIAKNLLPYLVSVIMLRMAIAVPTAIGSEVFITYIGLGLPVSMPSLGNLINVGRKLMASSGVSYQLVFPTIILSIITVSFYVIGNAFSDSADPRNHI